MISPPENEHPTALNDNNVSGKYLRSSPSTLGSQFNSTCFKVCAWLGRPEKHEGKIVNEQQQMHHSSLASGLVSVKLTRELSAVFINEATTSPFPPMDSRSKGSSSVKTISMFLNKCLDLNCWLKKVLIAWPLTISLVGRNSPISNNM